MRKTIIIIILNLLIINISSFAQTEVNSRLEKTGLNGKGAKEMVIIHQTIETSDGRVIAVGETTRNNSSNKDGYVAIFNPMATNLEPKRVGGTNDDVFNAVAQLPDGTFLLAGSTKRNGKEQAWLVQIDEEATVIREGVFNTGGVVAFHSVLASDEGSAFLIGSYDDDNGAEIKFMKIRNWQIDVDKNLQIGGFVKKISSAVLSHDGYVVIVGDTKKAKTVQGEDIWLVKIDKNGDMVKPFSQRYGEAKYLEEAKQIIKTSDNGFAIVGNTTNSDGKGYNAWLLKLDEFGKKNWAENYGGRDIDKAQSVVQTVDDSYYIVGQTWSHSSDARKSQVYFVKIGMTGKKIWEENDGDNYHHDWGAYITSLHNGYFLLTAATKLPENDNNSWFYSFKASDDNIYNSDFGERAFKRINWTITSDSKYLEADTRTALRVTFVNTAQNLIKNVQIKCKSLTKDIQPQSITYIGTFRSQEEKTVFIPLKTGVGLDDNTYPLEVEIFVGDKRIEKFSQTITTKKRAAQQVHIVAPPQYERLSDGTFTLKLTVKNPTNTTAQNLLLNIELPRGLKALGDTRVVLKPIEASRSAEINFNYQGDINTEIDNSKPSILCSLSQKNMLIDEKQVEAIPPLSIQGNLSEQLIWFIPDEATTMNLENIETDKPFYNIELRTQTTEPISSDKIKVFINGQSEEGSKSKVVDLTSSPVQNWQIFRRKIEFLEQGEYTIRVEIKTAKGPIPSKTVRVKYNPEKATLHVVSIGTTHSDLKYTAQDAVDIATFFQKQASNNTVFKDIKVTLQADSAKTDYMNFYRTITDLVERYDNNSVDNKITKKDYLILFISSHGKTGDNKQYKILPSGYKLSDKDKFTIDYQTDIIDNLNKIDCHKLVFIDACHSGAGSGAKGIDNADALLKINTAAIGTTILTSCRNEEQSYEDDTWHNGAFTKALLEAFSNQNCTDETGTFRSNQINDGYITIEEIVNFVKQRVPKMVALQKGSTKTQNPVLNDVSLDLKIPLVEVKN